MLNKIFNKKIIHLLTVFLALSLVFVAGSFHSSTKLELVAEYATQVVKNGTNGGEFACITVGKTENSGAIADSVSEFHNLYGTFRQTKITFASMMNPDKNLNIKIEDDVSDNLSILYLGPVGTVEYKGHYKHYTYPIEVMFPDVNTYDVGRYKAYISQNHAKRILNKKRGIDISKDSDYSLDDYKEIVKTLIPISINGESFDFVVQNIYYQTNYYYEGLNEVAGDFIMTSYYLPLNLRDTQQNMYFMSDYTYQNRYFMNYINSVYEGGKYDVKLNQYNLTKEVDTDKILSFYYKDDMINFDWLSVLILMISSLILVASLILLFVSIRNNSITNPFFYVATVLVLFAPYIIFKTISVLSNNLIFLSEISTKFNFFTILAYVLCLVFMHLIVNIKPKKHRIDCSSYYEINL